jgi:hypothetical protein
MSAEDWTPPPGTVKRTCLRCQRPFASREGKEICPVCQPGPRKGNRRTMQAEAETALARHGSIRKAAEALGVSASTFQSRLSGDREVQQ